jgi:lysophospholipase L1-like esterase
MHNATDAVGLLEAFEKVYALTGEVLKVGYVNGNPSKAIGLVDKLSRGMDVYVAVFGGSFTAGSGSEERNELERDKTAWPGRFRHWLAKTFPHSNITVENLAESGMCSGGVYNEIAHWARSLAKHPDLVILDYLVNDAKAGTAAVNVAYEALIRQVSMHLPQSQLLLIEDGCEYCITNSNS